MSDEYRAALRVVQLRATTNPVGTGPMRKRNARRGERSSTTSGTVRSFKYRTMCVGSVTTNAKESTRIDDSVTTSACVSSSVVQPFCCGVGMQAKQLRWRHAQPTALLSRYSRGQSLVHERCPLGELQPVGAGATHLHHCVDGTRVVGRAVQGSHLRKRASSQA